jgi:hypothetical protein
MLHRLIGFECVAPPVLEHSSEARVRSFLSLFRPHTGAPGSYEKAQRLRPYCMIDFLTLQFAALVLFCAHFPFSVIRQGSTMGSRSTLKRNCGLRRFCFMLTFASQRPSVALCSWLQTTAPYVLGLRSVVCVFYDLFFLLIFQEGGFGIATALVNGFAAGSNGTPTYSASHPSAPGEDITAKFDVHFLNMPRGGLSFMGLIEDFFTFLQITTLSFEPSASPSCSRIVINGIINDGKLFSLGGKLVFFLAPLLHFSLHADTI